MKIIFEKLDFLSPKITLFYKYKKRHSSAVGGLLTFIMIIICISYILRFIFRLILHTSPSVIFYKKYEKDFSKYFLDSSTIPHLIWFINNNFISKLNTKSIRIILLDEENNYAANTSNLKNYEHWVYDSCEKSDFNDYENYEHLIFNDYYINNTYNKRDISKAICIRYYYDKKEQRYYSSKDRTSNNKFKYPYLEHGVSNRNNTIMSIIIEKCSNNSETNNILGICEKEENINNYLNEINYAYIQVLDHIVDITDYHTPIKSYFMGLSSFLLHNNGYEINSINLSPLLIRSNDNFLNGNYIEKNSIIIDNTQNTIISSDNKIISKYLFCLKNYKQIYERKYIDLFDTFSSIGGILQFYYYVFYIINYFYNDFILILNTQNLFLNDPKNKKLAKLMTLNKYPNILESKNQNKNNALIKNYESNNILQELKYYKLVSKIHKGNLNDGDLSSIQLSESNNDKESYFYFNRKKDINEVESRKRKPRRSEQINCKSILKMKLKEDYLKKKKGFRYSMFDQKRTEIILPKNKDYYHINNINNIMRNNKENISVEKNENNMMTFGNSNNFNTSSSKKITFIDNRDRLYNFKRNYSFVGGVKAFKFLKNNKNIVKEDNNNRSFNIISPGKNIKLNENKKLAKVNKEKYYIEKLTFKNYIIFMCSRSKRRDILIIQQFRQKLLSEEHFFKSHLFLYLIIQKIKIDKDDKSDIEELYTEL